MGRAGPVAPGQQVFLDVEGTKQAAAFGDEDQPGGDALFGREASYVHIIEQNCPRRRLMEPGDRAQEG